MDERIEEYKVKILEAKGNINKNSKLIAKLLYEVKQIIPRKEWKNWYENNIGLSKSSVSEYLKAYKMELELQDKFGIDTTNISVYVLKEYGRMNEMLREIFIENNDITQMSVRDVSKVIKSYKEQYKEVKDEKVRTSQQKQKEQFNEEYEKFQKAFGDLNGLLCGYKHVIKEEDKPIYKKMYRVLAMNFHPDIIKDDGYAMKLINELKKEWGI